MGSQSEAAEDAGMSADVLAVHLVDSMQLKPIHVKVRLKSAYMHNKGIQTGGQDRLADMCTAAAAACIGVCSGPCACLCTKVHVDRHGCC